MSFAIRFPGEIMMPLLFVAVTVLMLTVAAFATRKQNQKAGENLGKLAAALGLGVLTAPPNPLVGSPPPRLEGTFRGRPVRVYNYTTGRGKNRVTWCALATDAGNAGGLTLEITTENILTRAGRALGIDDVTTGDEAFDRRFYLRSNDAAFIRAAFIPEVRAALAEAWRSGASGKLAVEGHEVKYAEMGSFADATRWERFAAMAPLVCDVAEIVGVHRG